MLSILYLLYSRFAHPSCSNEIWRKAIEQLDEKVSGLVLRDLTDVLTKLTSDSVEQQISDIMPRNDKLNMNGNT